MSKIDINFILDEDQVSAIGHRIGDWIRDQGMTDKGMAREFNVAPVTVKSWREGKNPNFKTFVSMYLRWGDSFLQYAFEPVQSYHEDSILRRIEHIRSDIKIIEEMAGRNETQNIGIHEQLSCVEGGETRPKSSLVGALGKAAGRTMASLTLLALLVAPIAQTITTFDDPQRTARSRRADRTQRITRNFA